MLEVIFIEFKTESFSCLLFFGLELKAELGKLLLAHQLGGYDEGIAEHFLSFAHFAVEAVFGVAKTGLHGV